MFKYVCRDELVYIWIELIGDSFLWYRYHLNFVVVWGEGVKCVMFNKKICSIILN